MQKLKIKKSFTLIFFKWLQVANLISIRTYSYLYSRRLLNVKGGESVKSSMSTQPAEKMSMEGRSSPDSGDPSSNSASPESNDTARKQ